MTTIRFASLTVAAIVLLTVGGGCASTNQTVDWAHFGGAEPAAIHPDAAVAVAKLDDGQDVIIAGTITDVCAVKGCWMKLEDESGDELFVRFKDYGFFVPRNATGHEVVLHGVAKRQVESVADQRHYAEDAGASAEEIAAITEPREQITVFADSVYIDGENLDAPYSAGN